MPRRAGCIAGLGFAEVGRRRRYYADGSDALVLRRDLGRWGAGRPRPAGDVTLITVAGRYGDMRQVFTGADASVIR